MATLVYTAGDTVRFSVEFRDYPNDPEGDPTTGPLLDPDEVSVLFYNSDLVAITELAAGINETSGIYHYDYTMPDEPGTYYVEWTGLVNSYPEIKREKFKVKFVGTS